MILPKPKTVSSSRATDIEIRPGVPADLAAVQALLFTTWHDTYDELIGAETVAETTSRWHSVEALRPQLDRPGTAFLVALEADALVGQVFADAHNRPVLIVSRLYVAPERQRGGVGRKLLHAAIALFADTQSVRLDVLAANRKGIAFYEREGFRRTGEVMDGGFPHLRMEKRLNR